MVTNAIRKYAMVFALAVTLVAYAQASTDDCATGTMYGSHMGPPEAPATAFPHRFNSNLLIFVAEQAAEYKMTSVTLADASASSSPSSPTDRYIRKSGAPQTIPYGDLNVSTVSDMWDGLNGFDTKQQDLGTVFEVKNVQVTCSYGDVWGNSHADIAISNYGTVATKNGPDAWKGVASMNHMETGVHYWEVTLVADPEGTRTVMFGVSRPGLDLANHHHYTNDAWYLYGRDGGLYGNGKENGDPQGRIDVGDKIGMLLNFTAGSLTFYLNGEVYGPGYPSGVEGPLVRSVGMFHTGQVVSVAPGPTSDPTPGPTPGPTSNPTPGPTGNPTPRPTTNPTPGPTSIPTPGPTSQLDWLAGAVSELSAVVKENSGAISEIKGLLNQRDQAPSCYGRRTQP
jgi:hypothetical protein